MSEPRGVDRIGCVTLSNPVSVVVVFGGAKWVLSINLYKSKSNLGDSLNLFLILCKVIESSEFER